MSPRFPLRPLTAATALAVALAVVLPVAPAAAQGRAAAAVAAAPVPARTADPTVLADEFRDPGTLESWRRFDRVEGWPDHARRVVIDPTRDGELVIEPHTSGWYEDFHAPFLFKEVSGDFVVTARVRADGVAHPTPRAAWSLAGLMVRAPRDITPRTWTPGGENWLFITTGVADDLDRPVIETKSTVNSRSALRLHPARAGWMELRITRRGAAFELASRYDGEDWIPRARFDRPDLPATVHVGLNAYSDWWTAKSLHGDPLKFDTTVLADGKPDLRLRVDWIRVDERVR